MPSDLLDLADFSQAASKVFSGLEGTEADLEAFDSEVDTEIVAVLSPTDTTVQDSTHSNLVLTVSLFSSALRPPSSTTNSASSGSPSTSHPQVLHFRGNEPLGSIVERMYCLTDRVAKGMHLEGQLEGECFLLIENTFYDDPIRDGRIDSKDDGISDDRGSSTDSGTATTPNTTSIPNTASTTLNTTTPLPATTTTTTTTSARPSDQYLKAVLAAPHTTLLPKPLSASQKSLKTTPWHSVPLQLGRPYLLVHQGGCEHHFIVTALTSDDGLSAGAGTTIGKVRRRACRVCERYTATKLLVNDKLMPENPTAICEACFEGFHGARGGDWYQDYEVFPYYHD